MKLNIQYSGKSTILEIEATAAVSALKALIETELDVPVHKQKLIVKGRVLDGDTTLESYNVGDNSKVLLLCLSSTQTRKPATQNRTGYSSLAGKADASTRQPKRIAPPRAATNSAGGPSKPSTVLSRGTRWEKTGVVSFKDQCLHSVPDDVVHDIQDLPESAIPSIKLVDLGGNRLTSLPDVLAALTGLQRLNCSSNLLLWDGVPWEQLGQLPRLRNLALDSNKLQLIAPALCCSTSLRALDVSYNSLQVLPDEIGQLRALEELSVHHNALQSLPKSLGLCSCLQWLDAQANKVTEVPAEFESLTVLRGLVLHDNRIRAVPSCVLRGCSQLHTLSLRDNPIRMEDLRECEGFVDYEARRKARIGKALDGCGTADFTEDADYKPTRR